MVLKRIVLATVFAIVLVDMALANGVRIERSDLAGDRFQLVAESIRDSFKPGGSNAGMSDAQQETVRESLNRIEDMLSNAEKSRGNRAQDRLLRTEMERVNSALAARPQSVVEDAGAERVCRREAVLGSNIPQVVCRTRAEIEAERVRAQDTLRVQERY